jgi:hypothetical protein
MKPRRDSGATLVKPISSEANAEFDVILRSL